MHTYEELKNEMLSIADVLKQYSESLQVKVFDILIGHYSGQPMPADGSNDAKVFKNQPATEQRQPVRVKKKTSSKESFQIDKDLNLQGKEGNQSFREFCESKSPSSNIEFNVVAIYYLSRVLGVSPVTIDQVYTCYKEIGSKVPGNLKQSIHDTSSSKYGYIDAGNLNDLRLPTRGENLVEHDLPKNTKAGK